MGNFVSPAYGVRAVPIEKIVANSYNPNIMAPPEMRLLELSIWEDGYTMPCVCYYLEEDDLYEIVDGYHRYLVMKQSQRIYDREKGMLPVTVIEKDISNRMASTIRHNRARGMHNLELMTEIVTELVKSGMSDKWIMRNIGMDKNELLQIINHEEVHIFGFYENNNFVGYCELDYRYKPKLEMVYFGLIPNYQGKGVGKLLLNSMLNIAWDLQPSPEKVWLTTCDLDHPSALNNYLKRGFKIFDEKLHAQKIFE